MGLWVTGFDIMEEFFLTAVADCSSLGVGCGESPHHWGICKQAINGGKTKRLDCWEITLKLRVDSYLT